MLPKLQHLQDTGGDADGDRCPQRRQSWHPEHQQQNPEHLIGDTSQGVMQPCWAWSFSKAYPIPQGDNENHADHQGQSILQKGR